MCISLNTWQTTRSAFIAWLRSVAITSDFELGTIEAAESRHRSMFTLSVSPEVLWVEEALSTFGETTMVRKLLLGYVLPFVLSEVTWYIKIGGALCALVSTVKSLASTKQGGRLLEAAVLGAQAGARVLARKRPCNWIVVE